ncbi:MAG: leucyl aminopeptidase [Anaerolineales bacterium]|jgi:leucyl aminopeptidase
MDVKISMQPLALLKPEALIVPVFEGSALAGLSLEADRLLAGEIQRLINKGLVRGVTNEVTPIFPPDTVGIPRLILIGLGRESDCHPGRCREAAGTACQRARDLGATSIALPPFLPLQGKNLAEGYVQATVEGAILGLYEFNQHRTTASEHPQVRLIELLLSDDAKAPSHSRAARTGEILARATNLARDWVNEPANQMTPQILANTALRLAEQFGLQAHVLGRKEMETEGMGALLGVTRGSNEPPTMAILEHHPGAGEPLVFVGKGITFDSGGISLKPGLDMQEMKSDMAGAAAVIASMTAIAQLELPLHVVGLAPACENLPSGSSYKPSDLLRALNGKTIEVISTDAEGRLILADALSYASRYKPAAVVDIATLTGACVTALGQDVAAGLFSNSEPLLAKLRAAGELAGEKLWPLPLYEEYREKIKSSVADIKNSGGRMGGVGTSAAFLREFTSYPWAHLDIAGVALRENPNGFLSKGATGFGVRTLAEFARAWATST